VVSWAGLLLHEPHYEVEAQNGFKAEGVYVAWLWYGSPASRYSLRPTRRITAVDDTPTPDLDAFLAAVKGRKDRAPVRLTMEKLDGSVAVQTLKLDLQYWPTQVLERQPDGSWKRTPVGDP
jgi:pro-apoptotic serine protease NMA111